MMEEDEPPMAEKAEPAIEGALASRSADVAEPEAPAGSERAEEDGGGNQDAREEWEEWMDEVDDPNFGVEPVFKSDATKLDDDAALLEHMEEEHVEPHVVEEVQVKESEPRGVEQDQALQRAFAFAERTCSDEQLVRACCVVLVLAGPGQRLTLKEIVSKVKEMDLYSFSKSCLRPHNDVNSVLSRAGAPFERVRIQGGGFCLVKGAYDEWLASGMPTSRDQPPEKKKLQIEVGVPEAAAAASEPDSDDEEPLVPAGSADEPDLQSPDGAEPQKAVVRRQRSKQRPRSSSGGSLSDPASLIARKVEIFWIDDNEWYPGTIAAYNPSTQLFTIFYEDDEVEETRIPHEHVRLMDESVSSETLVTHSWGQKWKNKHNNRQYYRSMFINNREIYVRECIQLRTEVDGQPPEVAKLVALFETPNKEMMFKGRFFCRKPELDRLGIDVPTENKGGAEELFLSDRVEERPLDAVLKRCTVNCTWEDSRNPRLEEEDQDPELFYSRAVLLETKEICSLEQLPGVEVANVVNHVPAEAATADAVVAAEGAAAAARRRFSVVLQSVWDSFDEPPKPVHRGEKSKESDKGWRGVGQRGQGKFRAQIRNPVSTNQIYLGSYVRPEVAARAFDTAMLALHGKEKADRLNFDLASYSEAEIHGARTYIETIAPLALKSSKVKPSPKDASANKHATEHKKAAAKGPEHVEKSSPKSVPGSIKRRLDDLPSQEERQQAKKAKIARSAAPGDISADVSQPRAADQIQYPRFKRKEPHLELSPAEPSTTTGPKNLTPQPPSQPDAPEPDSRAQADGRTVQSTVNNDRPQSFRIPRRSALSAAPGAPAMTVRSMSNGSLDALANSAVELADRSAAPPSTAARLHHSTPASSPRQPRERYPSHRERERLPASPIKLSGQAPVANGSAGREPTAMSQKTHYTYEDFKMKYRGRQPHSKPVTPMLPQAATGLHLPVPLWVQYREGFVFRCEGDTMDACFKHMLFGEKEALMPIIDEIDRATALFLYNTQSRYLYGVYECTARGGMNLQPNALVSRGPDGALTAYPAQVRVKQVQHFEPIRLSEFRRVVTYKPDASVGEELFDQKLSAEQVTKLMQLMHEKAAVLEDAGSPSATPAVVSGPSPQALAVASPHARASAEPSTRPHVDNDVPPPPLTPLPTVPSAPEQPPLPSVPPPPPPASQSQPLSEPTSFVREPSHSGATPAAVAANAEGAVDDGTASGRPSIPDLNLEPPEVAPVAAVAAADVDEELVRDAPPNEAQVDTGVRFSTGVEDRSRERQHDAAMSRSHSNVSGALSNREERSSAPVREDSQHLQEVRSDDQAPSRASHPQHNNSDQPWSREHSESRRNDSWRGDARKGADDRYYSTPRKQQWQASGSHRGYGNERDARKYSSSDRQGDRHYYDHRHNSDRVRKREGYHHSPHQDKRGGYKDYDRRPGPPSGRDRDGHERDRLRSTGDRDRDRERERDWDREQDRYYRDRQYDRQRERDRHYHQGSDHRWNERDHSPSRNRPGENARHGSDHDGSLRGSGIRNETGTSSAPAHIPDLNQNPSPQETMAAVHTSGGAVAGFQAQCGSSSSDTSDTSTPSSSSASDKEASLFAGVTQTR